MIEDLICSARQQKDCDMQVIQPDSFLMVVSRRELTLHKSMCCYESTSIGFGGANVQTPVSRHTCRANRTAKAKTRTASVRTCLPNQGSPSHTAVENMPCHQLHLAVTGQLL